MGGAREPALAEAPAHHLPPTCAFQQPDGFASQGGSLERAAQGFPKRTRTLSQHRTPSSSYTHSLLGTKRAVSLASRVSASARLFKVSFRFSAPRACSHQAIAQERPLRWYSPQRGEGGALCRVQPRGFSLSVGFPAAARAKTWRGDLEEGIITLSASRPGDPRSGFSRGCCV